MKNRFSQSCRSQPSRSGGWRRRAGFRNRATSARTAESGSRMRSSHGKPRSTAKAVAGESTNPEIGETRALWGWPVLISRYDRPTISNKRLMLWRFSRQLELEQMTVRQDHTTSPSASASPVKRASASTASRPASVTSRAAPLSGTGWRGYRFESGGVKKEIFLQAGLDTTFADLPVGQPALGRPGAGRDPQPPMLMIAEGICVIASTKIHGVWVPAFAGTTAHI